MKNKTVKQGVLLCLAVLVLIAILVLIGVTGSKETTNSYKVGLILTGRADDSGWNREHYDGVVSACKELGVELIVKENIAEGSGACNTAIRELVEKGVGMIMLSSYSYAMECKDTIDSYPQIAFYSISSAYSAKNVTSYFGRMYQARYLAGILAGLQTENNVIGYVAAMENSEVNRGINAFTLGVKSVNPKAKVFVYWTGSWEDSEKESDAAKKLIYDKSADVLTYHQNQPYTAQTADKEGVYSIGYHAVAEGLSEKYLTAVVWNWDALYYQIIKEYVQGKANTVERRWFSIDSGVVGLSEYSSLVSEEKRYMVNEAMSKILSGKDVFSGEIYDAEGILRCGEKETLSDDVLFENMDWLVEGVVIYNEEN